MITGKDKDNLIEIMIKLEQKIFDDISNEKKLVSILPEVTELLTILFQNLEQEEIQNFMDRCGK